ncbi:MAG: M20/M25/M40 family metallo-hydrolase [Acidobacteriota bacterium]|nr:M20/M25/M40 family metallo-hydrolase [Acidobacteriota bacterium]MDH3785454.1 M20/M25/M40 family metallo-hydrolase [Acidobacteriota bacterium]
MNYPWRTLVCLLTLTAIAQAANNSLPGDSGQITADELRGHVGYLAADDLNGRDSGGGEIREAEAYIANAFERFGLAPLPGHDSFFLPFHLYRSNFDKKTTNLTLSIGKEDVVGEVGQQFRPFDFSDNGRVDAEVVFAGYGVSAPDLGYDDYAKIDVEGKIVLLLRHVPNESSGEGSFAAGAATRYGAFATKAQVAVEHGAAGMILVTDPLNHGPNDDLRIGRRLTLDRGSLSAGQQSGPTFLAVHANQSIIGDWLQKAGADLSELQTALDSGKKTHKLTVNGLRASIGVQRVEGAEAVPARNVAGFLEGSDEDLKNEWIVIGGHHDHIGGYHGEGDTIFNGADDNASGISGVLELAQAFASREQRPRRSILFATFSAEEKGLLGSRAMVEQEHFPVHRTVFMFNLDMIGRTDSDQIQVYGDGYARGLREIVDAANEPVGLELTYAGTEYAGNSDHASFYQAGVPFMFFFTGLHDDYHQLGDHADKLDYDRMQQILTVGFNTIETMADADMTPAMIHVVDWLGIQIELVDRDGFDVPVVTHVADESRGYQSGLRSGDVLTALDRRPVAETRSVGKGFRDVQPGSEVELSVRRGEATHTIAVERAKTGYMGVFPTPVDEDRRSELGLPDNEGILLRSVVADGPCGKAGLVAGDIILRVDGRPISASSLSSILSQIGAGETVDMLVLRESERLTIPVTLGERPGRRR